jgi:hypothetical protein
MRAMQAMQALARCRRGREWSGPQGWPGVNMWHVGILSPKDRADR